MIVDISGYKVLLDEVDYDKHVFLSLTKWVAYKQRNSHVYFVRHKMNNDRWVTEKLHRTIMGMEYRNGLYVDHINGNTLDNRKTNLRVCTIKENARNRKVSRSNVSGYKGVCFRKDSGLYQARIWIDGKNKHLGFYIDPVSAHNAYCVAAAETFGDFARFK